MSDKPLMAKGDIPENVYLVISSQVYPITKEVTTIGRKLDNDIVIAEELVSRSHARIACESRQFVLYDLESTGGTYVNNKRIDRCVLYSGDIILLANIPVMFIHDATRILDKSKKRTGKLD